VTYASLPKILTVEEIADYLRIGVDVVLKELEQGHIQGFKVGTEWRCTDANLLAFVSGNHKVPAAIRSGNSGLEYDATDFAAVGPFDYQWPKVKEHFEGGFETTRRVNSRTHTFKIGFTDREAAEQLRRRVVVWLDNWPLVEFAGSNKYQSDGLVASIIKIEGGKQLRPTARIPEEYSDFRVGRYDSVVQGAYASRNMAIIVNKDDLESMIRHAMIRARLKGII
jgi:excisionase family DNA binding protein